MYDVVVIGAGVGGLMASGVAAKSGASVLLLEKMEKPARKLRITGKGRCNITNNRAHKEFLERVRAGRDFIEPAFLSMDNGMVVDFLESIGLPLVVERGERVFPASGRAQDVANAMENWAKEQGVTIRCNAPVLRIGMDCGRVAFVEIEGGERVECRAVVLATGGVSYPLTGSTGDGHQMAYDMGHNIVELRPALVPLVVQDSLKNFAGLELRNVNVSLVVGGEKIDERFGELTFYENSIAGPTVIALSRQAVDAILDQKSVELWIDLKPALSETKLMNRIVREVEALPNAPLKVLLDKLSPRPTHAKIFSQSGVKSSVMLKNLTREHVGCLIRTIKGLWFVVVDYRPFSEAIITAGGVDTNEVNQNSMESKIVGNLFFAGELLDIDADTGGYNIQLALSSGAKAGYSAATKRSNGGVNETV